jgi:NitT/TauT family transport system substrate-binding protein
MISTKAFFFLLILLIVSAVAGTACVSQNPLPSPASATPPAYPAPSLTTVRLAYTPTTAFGPVYIAQEEGFFAQQGITVQFEKVTGSSAAFPLLVNGDIDILSGPVTTGMVNVIAKGTRVRIVADKGSVVPGACPSNAFMVRRALFDNGTVRNISDLKGMKVMGLTGSTDQSYTFVRALAKGNLTQDDVELVKMDYPSAVVAFENGAIDAAVLTEPYITQTVSSGSAVVLLPGDEYIPGYALPLVYGPSILERNPEAGRKFMVAYLQGVKQYNQGKTERNLAIIGKYTGLDRDILNQTCWYPVSEDGSLSRQGIRDSLDWMYANKGIAQNLEDDQLYDMSYVDYANGIMANTTNP